MRGRYSFVVIASLALALALIGLFWNAHQVSADNRNWHAAVAAQQRQAAAEQASQQRQGEQLEQRLCTTLQREAALKPPAGSPAGNPSRAYEQAQHAILAQLGPDIGCGGKR